MLVSDGLLSASEERQAAIHEWFAVFRSGMTVALATHINADGDGCGSQAALARLLGQRGIDCRIVNPTPWPPMFDFLLHTDVADTSGIGAAALDGIDALVVLDINDVRRLGKLADKVRSLTVPVLVVDHHIAGDEPVGSVAVADTAACATGELVYDMAVTLGLELTPLIAQSLYAAIVTDTGSFRFSNTSPRAHAIAAHLLSVGVDPEEMYRRIYAQVSVGRLRLLSEALASLMTEPETGLSWISVEADATDRFNVTNEELDGIVEHPRSVTGTRLAVFFRDLGHDRVKVSFRSTGEVNVQQFARRYGGGGHAKASGAMLSGSLDDVRNRVIADARSVLVGA